MMMSDGSGWKGAQHGRFQSTILFWSSIVDNLSWWHWACRSSTDLRKSQGSPYFPFFWLCNANKVSTTPRELALLQLEERDFDHALLDQDSHWINNFHRVLFDHLPQLSNRLYRSIWCESWLNTAANIERWEDAAVCLIQTSMAGVWSSPVKPRQQRLDPVNQYLPTSSISLD